MKKSLISLIFISSILNYASENSIKTDFDLSNTTKKEENFFSYSTSTNLKLKPHKMVELELGLKSSRENLLKSDIDNKSLKKSNRKNHDLGIKLGASFNHSIDKLNIKASIVQYIPTAKKLTNNDGYIYEMIEGDNKNSTANTLINFGTTGSYNGINILTNINYKASNFFDYTVDESYLKFNYDINKDINEKYKIGSNFDFNLDLDLMNRRYKPLEKEEDDIPETMVNNYVTQIKNKFNLYLIQTRKEKNDKIKYNFNIDNIANLSRRDIAGDIIVSNNVLNTGFEMSYIKDLNFNEHKISLNNMIAPSFKIFSDYTRSSNEVPDKYDLYFAFEPKLNSSIDYSFNKNGLSNNTSFNLSYYPSIAVNNYIIAKDNKINHTIKANLNSKLSYIKGIHNLTLDTSNDLSTLFYDTYKRLNLSTNLSANYILSIENDKFTISLKNAIKTNTKANIDLFDTLKYNFDLSTKLEKLILDKHKHKLSNDTKLSYSHSSEYLFEHKTIRDINSVEGKLKTNLNQRESLNKFIAENELKYSYDLLSNLKLLSNLLTTFELDTLVVKTEKVSSSIYEIPKGKEKLKVADSYNRPVNIGGNIVIEPSMSIEYNPINTLKLIAGISAKIKFDRNILDKVDDKNRVDNKTYDYADKNFEFKQFTPKLKLGLEYKW